MLSAADIELLGRVAYMLGYDDDYIAALERAHKVYVEAGSLRPAIRSRGGSATTCCSAANRPARRAGSPAGSACWNA